MEEDHGRDDGAAVDLGVRCRKGSRAEAQDAVCQGGSDGEGVSVESAVGKRRAWEVPVSDGSGIVTALLWLRTSLAVTENGLLGRDGLAHRVLLQVLWGCLPCLCAAAEGLREEELECLRSTMTVSVRARPRHEEETGYGRCRASGGAGWP